MRSGVDCTEPRRNAFEIFGLDLVLDEGLRPWLIEVNEAPNLSTHGSALKEAILAPMLGAALDLVTLPEHTRAPPERHAAWRWCGAPRASSGDGVAPGGGGASAASTESV